MGSGEILPQNRVIRAAGRGWKPDGPADLSLWPYVYLYSNCATPIATELREIQGLRARLAPVTLGRPAFMGIQARAVLNFTAVSRMAINYCVRGNAARDTRA